jgi:hypothetical protein
VTVFEVLFALFVLAGLFMLFFFGLDGPPTLDESSGDLFALGQNISGDKWEFVSHVMVVFVSGVKSGVLNEFL